MDPIADFLNRIKNAQAVGKPIVLVPFSKMKQEISKILEKRNLIERTELKGRKHRKNIKIVLKYDKDGEPGIRNFKMISKPGQRIYQGWKKIRKERGIRSTVIVSTSQGLMTAEEARKKKVGGEVIAEIW